MTEPDKTKIQVRKPAGYMEVSTPQLVDDSHGGGKYLNPNSQGAKPTGNGGSVAGSVHGAANDRTASPTLSIRSIEDAKDPSGDLIEAIRTVFRVVTAKIAHHEREAQRLREALAPFASHARQSVAPQPQSDGATVEALLRIADELNRGEQQ